MGDRNNPIMFGPEWLRNLARERNAGGSASGSQAPGGAGAGPGPGGAGAHPSSSSSSSSASNTMPKVLLAKLRYGREEMLALYDRSAEAPAELVYNDALYQPRGKPPIALNNTFDDDMRETARNVPSLGGMTSVRDDRFGMGRGLGRGSIAEGRGRGRQPFVRQTSVGRGTWHAGAPRAPGYGGGAEDDMNAPVRAWSGSNGAPSTARSVGEQADWAQNKMYRTKRPGTNTNWRQSRDDEEWRATESARPRSMQPDKWERDWGDRATQDKPQSSWTNRRTWVGGDDDNLPEWAVDNAEACGGTFDSSGAFHGYSNDDTNLPKPQDTSHPLTRSHTHGSFVRSKTAEEGSDEWWASEKAKKLSPKRFDAIEIKFKKPTATTADGSSGSGGSKAPSIKDNSPPKGQAMQEDFAPTTLEHAESSNSLEDAFNKKAVRFTESKTFDALMRSDINLAEASDERGNFQSVMIAPNNSLRQKHQNMIASVQNSANHKSGILQILQNAASHQAIESEMKKHQSQEEKIVEDIMELTLEDREIKDMLSNLPQTSDSVLVNPPSSGMSSVVTSRPQHRLPSPVLTNKGLAAHKGNLPTPSPGLQSHGGQPVGITNSALNASLGLSRGGEPVNRPLGMPLPGVPLQGVPPPVLPGMMPPGSGMPGFPASSLAGRTNVNLNSSLFLGQTPNNNQGSSSGDIPMPNHSGQSNMFPMHGLQHSGSQTAFGSSIYSNIMPPPPPPPPAPQNAPNPQNLDDFWYYEDPKKIVQGPFSSREMYHWYRAGFFTPSLMVRRAADTIMRPLGSYGPVVPFAQMDILSFPMSSGFEVRNQGPHESLLNSQQGMPLDVMNMGNMNLSDSNPIDSMQFGAVGLMRNPQFGQQQMDSLWGQPAQAPQGPDVLWLQQAMSGRNEARVNNLPMFFWDQQPSSAMTPNSLRPDVITKDMKTEDEILAQLRASQNNNPSQNLNFLNNKPIIPPTSVPNDGYQQPNANVNVTPNMDELQKFMQEKRPIFTQPAARAKETKLPEKEKEVKPAPAAEFNQKLQQHALIPEPKVAKQPKVDNEKPKVKDTVVVKTKTSKKVKEDKKEEGSETKTNEEDTSLKVEKKPVEPSSVKPKKEEKPNKKEMEKEKKEWLKEGFTIVKAAEKPITKETKKKTDETKTAEETERRRKEEELTADEEKKTKNLDTLKKQQDAPKPQRQQQSEPVARKAPWSAVATHALQDTSKEGPTLAEIQRLEREKKLHQMKEQQQMVHLVAQQQATALAREQELQAGLGWAKKKGNSNVAGQSLAEIQAEARRQAMAVASAAAAQAAQAQAQAQEEAQAAQSVNHAPWANSQNNASGFWDTQLAAQAASSAAKQPDPPAGADHSKPKKKVQLIVPVKKDSSPAADFESWCITVLTSWNSKIDVPTFVGFLKDIESPYEVKDYVKCYLGESRDTSEFARQFLERRSKLLRVGMVTPSDDLASPAVAVNPRTNSGSDYMEVKGKGKKTKKNKMLKVDARILGFSVTAAEDRINVGDIDTA